MHKCEEIDAQASLSLSFGWASAFQLRNANKQHKQLFKYCTCVVGELNWVDGTDIKTQHLKHKEVNIEAWLIVINMHSLKDCMYTVSEQELTKKFVFTSLSPETCQ